jgi:hypothetical protein
MDTYKDARELEEIAQRSEREHGRPPWLNSQTVASW